MAAAARGFIGFGSAFAFVGAVYVATVWFPPARLALIAGMTTSVGMIGEVVGQYPMARLAEAFDWRTVVLWSGYIGGGLGVLMFLVIPRRPSWFSATVARQTSCSAWTRVLQLLAAARGAWRRFLQRYSPPLSLMQTRAPPSAQMETFSPSSLTCSGKLSTALACRAEKGRPLQRTSELRPSCNVQVYGDPRAT